MDPVRDQFWEDVDSGELHIRDKWQFALKSDFFPQAGHSQDKYTQEFYFFIPNSLQINASTYSKDQFFIDQLSLIRYKTPVFSFAELQNPLNLHSPLIRILGFGAKVNTEENRKLLSNELKLLGNVVRSMLRSECKRLTTLLQTTQTISSLSADFTADVEKLCRNINQLDLSFLNAKAAITAKWKDELINTEISYIEEFINDVVLHYLMILLENLRLSSHEYFQLADQTLCQILIEKKHATEKLINQTSQIESPKTLEGESSLFRANLLDKFVLDALLLETNRSSINQRYYHIIAAISAGIAMMLYFILFTWLGTVFLINSQPFIILAVLFYVLKDRIKEILRAISYQQMSRWFPDYKTVIYSPDKKQKLGEMHESFSFIEHPQLSEELTSIRNVKHHGVLDTFERPEDVMYYKRVVEINQLPKSTDTRHSGLNIIYRFNIHRFLQQASDPVETHLALDSVTKKLISVRLPKVYHLNLILRSSFLAPDLTTKVELKKLRIIFDKNGIKRIEQVAEYCFLFK